jgi:23S rRNA-/tRNA-specific pseudouridylate synthase
MKQVSNYTIIFEDEDILVVNKKSALLVASDRYDNETPRLDKLLEKDYGKLFALHRIDKDASGLVVYAKTSESHKKLSAQFKNNSVKKIYHALIYGRPVWNCHTSALFLLCDADSKHRTVVNKKSGKPCKIDFCNKGSAGPYSWIIAETFSECIEQVRAALLEEKLSIVCDSLYGGNQKPVRLSEIKRSYHGDVFEERPLLSRLALHLYSMEFVHPKTDERLTFTAPYFKDMDSVRKQLAKLFRTDPLAE